MEKMLATGLLVVLVVVGMVFCGWLAFYLQPQWLVSAVQSRFSDASVLFYVPGEERRMALTIDDAPSNSTEAILDELKAAGVKATFFIISSYVKGREKTLQRMVDEGHELGNHHTKDEASWRLAPAAFEADLLECQKVIDGFQPPSTRRHKWYRPGQGFFTPAMLSLLSPYGYRLALGNVYPHDANGFSRLQSDWPRLNSLYLRTRARGGAIVVVHDRPWTVEVLHSALPLLTPRFDITTLSQLVDGAAAAGENATTQGEQPVSSEGLSNSGRRMSTRVAGKVGGAADPVSPAVRRQSVGKGGGKQGQEEEEEGEGEQGGGEKANRRRSLRLRGKATADTS